ncbi:FAD-binding oxidoreductase [Thermoleophilia bacterium SCSIO 60948]|nr:FAD-binding oxidoreductase [Thermoleophilia bacterium SCSIO 60948]
MSWSGWGDPAEATPLGPEVVSLLEHALGVKAARPAVERGAVRLPDSRLGDDARQRLAAVVGSESIREDADARLHHTRGKSTADLLRIRSGEATDAPDAVVLPGAHDEILELLRICSEARIAVVPFGGGTSVVGGLEPRREGFAAIVALDLQRLNRLVELDEVSRVATLEPGLRGPDAEALLGERGYTIGHHPQSFEYATIGGFAAARSSGQGSAGYGRFDERVVGLRVATPRGAVELGRAPKSAAGPDLRQLFLGSEGAFGVITAVSVEVRPRPQAKLYEGWRFASFAEGATALRRLAQDGPLPTVLRLSDEAETALNLARPDELGAGGSGGCLAVTGYEGSEADVEARRTGVAAVLAELGAEHDPQAGDGWEHGRYRGPYLRDALLDAGALAETLETTTFWSGVARLYESVGASLRDTLTGLGTPPVVLCHISHVYRSGASLYFTIGAAQLDDPLAQWRAAKDAASDAILAAGGSISHHHGVGTDHREHLAREIGPLGVEVLRAVKSKLDPDGILNPGVLIA